MYGRAPQLLIEMTYARLLHGWLCSNGRGYMLASQQSFSMKHVPSRWAALCYRSRPVLSEGQLLKNLYVLLQFK
jgi:hypothetical protein